MTDDLVGRGLPMFLPAGYTVWQELENYIKEKERARCLLYTSDKWYGVTYREDKPTVVAAIAQKTQDGLYLSLIHI